MDIQDKKREEIPSNKQRKSPSKRLIIQITQKKAEIIISHS